MIYDPKATSRMEKHAVSFLFLGDFLVISEETGAACSAPNRPPDPIPWGRPPRSVPRGCPAPPTAEENVEAKAPAPPQGASERRPVASGRAPADLRPPPPYPAPVPAESRWRGTPRSSRRGSRAAPGPTAAASAPTARPSPRAGPAGAEGGYCACSVRAVLQTGGAPQLCRWVLGKLC